MSEFIYNRNGKKIAVVVENKLHRKGLVFVMHGLGGFKEGPTVHTFARSFIDHGYTTVLFDTTNTFGESDGNFEHATTTNYYEDLEDVIAWASTQPWYQQPFCLAGHSLGGFSVAYFAEQYPEKVKALAPISTTVSGQLSLEAPASKDWPQWKAAGVKVWRSSTPPHREKRLPWSHFEDRLRYDLLPNAAKLTMPVLMIVGSKDDSTPPEHQKILFDKIPGRKELHIIPGAPHTFRDPEHLAAIKAYFNTWIQQL